MAEEEGGLGVQGQPQLHGESEISLGYITSFLKKPTQKEKIKQTNKYLKVVGTPLILGLGRQRQTDLLRPA